MAEHKLKKFCKLHEVGNTYVFEVAESESDVTIKIGRSHRMIHKFKFTLKIFKHIFLSREKQLEHENKYTFSSSFNNYCINKIVFT